jgi:hypothetical protein
MRHIKRFKVSIIFLGLWLGCFIIYLASLPDGGFSNTSDGAKNIGGFMSACSGGVINYGSQGYRCDAYGPSKIATSIILIGTISFMVAVVTFFIKLISKSKK